MEDFNINDIVVIFSEPKYWNSRCNDNNITSIVKYPFIGKITKIDKSGIKESIELGGGGWSLSTLKDSRLIKKISLNEVSYYINQRPYTHSELLALFDRLYPIGTKYKSLTSNSVYVRENELKINAGRVYEVNKGYLFFASVLAEIITTTTDKMKLKNVKIEVNGDVELIDKIVKQLKTLGYKFNLSFVGGNYSKYNYICIGKTSEVYGVMNSTEITNTFTLADIGLEEESNRRIILTKEQLFNSKIDVSASKELSKAVQERLFELGFSWQGKAKVTDCDYI